MDNSNIFNSKLHITKDDHCQIIVCPHCKINFPIIKLFKKQNDIYLYLKCPCLPEADQSMTLDNYLSFLREYKPKTGMEKCQLSEEHSNISGKVFCLDCGKWLCEKCIPIHQNVTKLHPLLNQEINLSNDCVEHKEKFTSFCPQCNQNTCNKCINSTHKSHCIERYETNQITKVKEAIVSIENTIKFNQKIFDTTISNIISIQCELTDLVERMQASFDQILRVNESLHEYVKTILRTFEITKNIPNYSMMWTIRMVNLNKSNLIVEDILAIEQDKLMQKIEGFINFHYVIQLNNLNPTEPNTLEQWFKKEKNDLTPCKKSLSRHDTKKSNFNEYTQNKVNNRQNPHKGHELNKQKKRELPNLQNQYFSHFQKKMVITERNKSLVSRSISINGKKSINRSANRNENRSANRNENRFANRNVNTSANIFYISKNLKTINNFHNQQIKESSLIKDNNIKKQPKEVDKGNKNNQKNQNDIYKKNNNNNNRVRSNIKRK